MLDIEQVLISSTIFFQIFFRMKGNIHIFPYGVRGKLLAFYVKWPLLYIVVCCDITLRCLV